MTPVWYTSGAPGASALTLSELYVLFCAAKRGEASVRFKDTSHRRIIFFDISYLDAKRTFGEMYKEEDCHATKA